MTERITVWFLLTWLVIGGCGILVPTDARGEEAGHAAGHCYDAAGNAIACRGTGQDGEIQAGLAWPAPRFMDNGDGTVTDSASGIMWLKDADCFGPMTWLGAEKAVADFSRNPSAYDCAEYTADYGDWALPNVNELAAMLNADTAANPDWLRIKGFKDVEAGAYWSSTSYVNPYSAWSVNMLDGTVKHAGKLASLHVWPMRPVAGQTERLAVTGQQQSYGPRDDGATRRGLAWPAPRFIDKGDGTVLDALTGLLWLKDGGCFEHTDWQSALDAVASFNRQPGAFACKEYSGNFTDWRLPNRKELRSLVDYGRDYPALPASAAFVNLQQTPYWVSTTSAQQPDDAYAIGILDGALEKRGKSGVFAPWPVRTAAAGAVQLMKTFPTESPRQPVQEEAKEPEAFIDNGDGTITDTATGLMWLKDAYCLGKKSWDGAHRQVEELNNNPGKYAYRCVDYDASYTDWSLPDISELEALVKKGGGDPVAWLEKQGFVKLQQQNYWTSQHNMLNLYYAWLVNMRSGERRNYPKEFEFYIWPVRKAVTDGS